VRIQKRGDYILLITILMGCYVLLRQEPTW
jgi:hypothetical protein